jgi:hypothetical protein
MQNRPGTRGNTGWIDPNVVRSDPFASAGGYREWNTSLWENEKGEFDPEKVRNAQFVNTQQMRGNTPFVWMDESMNPEWKKKHGNTTAAGALNALQNGGRSLNKRRPTLAGGFGGWANQGNDGYQGSGVNRGGGFFYSHFA